MIGRVVRKLAITGTVLLWLALLAGLLNRFAWPFDLFAHFRVQYAALFVVLTLLLLILRQWVFALAALVGFCVSAVPMMAYLPSVPGGTAVASARHSDISTAVLQCLVS